VHSLLRACGYCFVHLLLLVLNKSSLSSTQQPPPSAASTGPGAGPQWTLLLLSVLSTGDDRLECVALCSPFVCTPAMQVHTDPHSPDAGFAPVGTLRLVSVVHFAPLAGSYGRYTFDCQVCLSWLSVVSFSSASQKWPYCSQIGQQVYLLSLSELVPVLYFSWLAVTGPTCRLARLPCHQSIS
jgi:hypothetical protein